MEYEVTYRGHHIVIITVQQTDGDWKSKAELLDSGKRIPLVRISNDPYSLEEEARRAALSAAAGAIDLTLTSKGKP